MSWFNRGNGDLVGIDISSAVVKLVELSKKGDVFTVDTYAVAPLAREDADNKISYEQRISDAIKKVLKFSKSKGKTACIAVPGASVKKAIIQVPINLSEYDLEDQVRQEADKYVEYTLSEMHLDYEVIGINKDNPELQDVLFAASRQELINEKINIVESAGLIPKVVDVDTFAMENMFSLIKHQLPHYKEDQLIAICDVGASMTTLMILDSGHHIYDTEQSFGGKQLTEAIQHHYQMNFDEAGYAKRHGGLLDGYSKEILVPFSNGLVRELERLIDRYYSSSDVKKIDGTGDIQKIDGIVLAGGCSSIDGIADLVSAAFKLPTIVANPFTDMKMSRHIEEGLHNDAPALVIACGLALRKFD